MCAWRSVCALIGRKKIDRTMIQVWGNYGRIYSLQHEATWEEKGIRQETRKEI